MMRSYLFNLISVVALFELLLAISFRYAKYFSFSFFSGKRSILENVSWVVVDGFIQHIPH